MSEFHALVPAAGFGARMGNELPKQYLDLAGRPMIWHALSTLCANPDIKTVFVVLAPDDEHFARYDWSHCADKLAPLYCGGATRAESVANGLLAEALARCSNVTDEASAVEAMGLQPKLVASDSSNLKVTYPQDIVLAELLLKQKM